MHLIDPLLFIDVLLWLRVTMLPLELYLLFVRF